MEILTFTALARTIHRVIIDWTQLLVASTQEPDLPYTVPTALGIALTTAPSGSPAAPTAGPISDPTGPWWWTQGTSWAPIGPYGAGGDLYSGDRGRIDRHNNTAVSGSDDNTLWLVSEAYNGSAAFDTHYLSAYIQVLYEQTGS